ncbi:serine hydrolase domain-containing protein [Micromonospora sp. NPDC093277]|uniref:serine hydrolase domain-containing protein n=1 Tax=Micromonospora sp. NPDC093277 TaxID=3364291 RepID=UPI00381F8681
MRWLTVLTALVLAAVSSAADPDPMQHDVDAIRALGVMGVSARVATADGRSRVLVSGVADRVSRRPMPRDGYLRIASTRKTFTATVVLQLAAEGRLSLDDTIERWLPGVVRGNGNDGQLITVRDLLRNTSGIHDDLPGYATPEEYRQMRFDVHTRDELVARAMAHAPDFAPGTGWGYSNTGILLADMVIERVTGRPLRTEVTDRIVRPLGLRHTMFPGTTPGLPEPRSPAYQVFPGGAVVDVTVQVSSDPDGVLATPADLEVFFRALLGGRLLPPAQLAEMQDTMPLDDEVASIWPGGRYGLGLVSRPLPCGGLRWGHDGGDGGYITVIGVSADGRRSAVVSMNTALGDAPERLLAQQRAADALVGRALCRR